MAESPGHKLGQFIGNALEVAIGPYLGEIAREFDLYLDYAGPRRVRGRAKVVRWEDSFGNKHNLDYVFERDGSTSEIGVPAAFIESAWRSYTKHSINKAKEIQGAVLPLLATYYDSKPFAGAVLTGIYTDAALEQLRSNGFSILHIPYEAVVDAFREHRMDIAFTESTSDKRLARQFAALRTLKGEDHAALGETLRNIVPELFRPFTSELRSVFSRTVRHIEVLPLYGTREQFADAASATAHLQHHTLDGSAPCVKFAVSVHYSTDERIDAVFDDADGVARFLSKFS